MAKTGVRGTWRIVEMDLWDQDALELVAPALIEFRPDRTGRLSFIAIDATLDVRYSESDGSASAEFSWEGFDEGDQVSGRGSASLHPDGTVRGHIYFHMGDDSSFVATRTGHSRSIDDPDATRPLVPGSRSPFALGAAMPCRSGAVGLDAAAAMDRPFGGALMRARLAILGP